MRSGPKTKVVPSELHFELHWGRVDDGSPEGVQDPIFNFGDYRLGLTSDEINRYIWGRRHDINPNVVPENYGTDVTIARMRHLFGEIAGVNTVAEVNGEMLMYRHDVLRFANVLFDKKPTYWD